MTASLAEWQDARETRLMAVEAGDRRHNSCKGPHHLRVGNNKLHGGRKDDLFAKPTGPRHDVRADAYAGADACRNDRAVGPAAGGGSLVLWGGGAYNGKRRSLPIYRNEKARLAEQ